MKKIVMVLFIGTLTKGFTQNNQTGLFKGSINLKNIPETTKAISSYTEGANNYKSNAFKINGHLIDMPNAEKVYINYVAAGNIEKSDSAEVVDGRYQFQGNLEEPMVVYLRLKNKDRPINPYINDWPHIYKLLLAPVDMQLTAQSSFDKTFVTGNPQHDKYINYFDSLYHLYAIEKKYNILADSLEKKFDYKRLALVKSVVDSLDAIEASTVKNFVLANPKEVASLYAVIDFARLNNKKRDFRTAFFMLDTSVQNLQKGKELAYRISEMDKMQVGKTTTDFIQPDTTGNPISLSSFKGKYVYVDFWASWCGPCRLQNPFIKSAQKMFMDKNFVVMGVSMDDNRKQWMQAIHTDKLERWINLSDLAGRNNAAALLYGVHSIPQNMLIDPNGKIIAINMHGLELEEKLKTIFDNR